MKEFIDYLERKIEGCDSLGGMEREKAIYQSVLKDYRKQFAISDVVGQSEQLGCDDCVDGQKWSPYYAKYVKCDCSK